MNRSKAEPRQRREFRLQASLGCSPPSRVIESGSTSSGRRHLQTQCIGVDWEKVLQGPHLNGRFFGGDSIAIISQNLIVAALVTVSFSALARAMRGVSRSGMIAGAVVCFLLLACAGLAAFAGLITVFALAWATTKFGYQRKQRLGTAERKDGRTASQVLANLATPAICAILYGSTGKTMFVVAMAAALAEAAADTVSSEVGQAAGRAPRLITTWKSVPIGTDGAISMAGTMAGVVGALIVASVGVIFQLVRISESVIIFGAAVLGMFADSLLGAWLERRGRMNNDAVNFLSTVIAGVVAASTLLAVS
jgi:uncharacterized protein (TIGR00297 family)